MKFFLKTFVAVALIAVLYLSILRALDNSAKYDCHQWAGEATSTPGFFITKDQKAQCDYYGIHVNATIHG